MEKNLFSLSIISAALLVSTSINAAVPLESQELTVSGKLLADGCNLITFTGYHSYNMKNIPTELILPEQRVWLSDGYKLSSRWTIRCSNPTTMSVKVEDNRASTSTDSTLFGMGAVNTNGKLGGFKIIMSESRVDDKPAMLLLEGTKEPKALITISPNDTIKWVDGIDSSSMTGTEFASLIATEVQLGSQADMNGPLVDDTKIDGSAKLTFTYGI